MIFTFNTSALITLAFMGIACYYACVIWSRRPNRGSTAFTIFILCVVAWTLSRLLVSSAQLWEIKILLAKVKYFFLAATAIWWLAFAADYCGMKFWRRPRNLILLYVIPVISLLLVITQKWHGIEWLSLNPSTDGSGFSVIWEHKFLFWLQTVYLSILILCGYLILWRYTLKTHGVYGRQIGLLLIGTLIPILGIFFFGMGGDLYRGVDLVMVTLTIAIVIYAWTIFRYRLMDVVPVARGALVEKIPDGILVLDNHGLIQDINPALEKMLNLSKLEVVSRPLSHIWPQMDVIFDKLQPGKEIEISNGPRCLDITLTELLNKQSVRVGRLLVIRDVTERRQMERTLRESEARYSTLVEQSNEVVLIVQDGVLKFANHTMYLLSGYTIGELIGHPFFEFIAPQDRTLTAEIYQRRMKGEDVLNIYELKVLHKNGEIRDMEVSAGQIMFDGKTAFMYTARDITERKLTQRKLEGLYEEEKRLRASLQEEIEKRSKYTRALVHELNTPLTSILASGELLEAEIEDGTLAALVANIRRSSHNLKQRIDELIELARGETGLLKINALPVDMGRLMREIESETRPLVKKKGLELELKVEGELPLALGDQGRLRQVLFNLISNAMKYTQSGKVEVRGRKVGESIEVSVKDSGRGIGPEEMEHLFDPYRRKRNEGQELGGLGIGLALSKMYIDLHGGKIEVESEAGQGSTFRFTVPIYH
jgi:PAS domain S-box-containing protein